MCINNHGNENHEANKIVLSGNGVTVLNLWCFPAARWKGKGATFFEMSFKPSTDLMSFKPSTDLKICRPVEAAPDIPATAATGTPITIPTPVSEVATAPEDRAAVTAPRQTTE
ncbi:hypothetical protein ACROYT_G001684 [Oculina patagonica]